jgi:ABC-type Zn uptake system ZnuABC Zn-binding protein ZnuA
MLDKDDIDLVLVDSIFPACPEVVTSNSPYCSVPQRVAGMRVRLVNRVECLADPDLV